MANLSGETNVLTAWHALQTAQKNQLSMALLQPEKKDIFLRNTKILLKCNPFAASIRVFYLQDNAAVFHL